MPLQSTEWFSRNGIECARVNASRAAFPRHCHDEYVISANLTGTEEIWLAGKTALVKPGQVTLYNPGTIQASRFDSQPVAFISLHVSQTVMKTLADEEARNASAAPALREGILDNPRLFHALYGFAASAHQAPDEEQEQALILLCGELLETRAIPTGEEEKRIAWVIDYLRAHLHLRPQLDALAQMAGLSKYHLVRLFARHTGMPPLQYHMQLRLHAARDLLRSRVHPLDAALMLGFYDQSHFINAFRKVMGTTPQHYAAQVTINSR